MKLRQSAVPVESHVTSTDCQVYPYYPATNDTGRLIASSLSLSFLKYLIHELAICTLSFFCNYLTVVCDKTQASQLRYFFFILQERRTLQTHQLSFVFSSCSTRRKQQQTKTTAKRRQHRQICKQPYFLDCQLWMKKILRRNILFNWFW